MKGVLRVAAGLAVLCAMLVALGSIFPQNRISVHYAGPTAEQTKEEPASVTLQAPPPAMSQDSASPTPAPEVKAENKLSIDTVTLGAKNTIVFRGPVTDQSVSEFQRKILDMSYTLSKSDTIFMVIDSPGGSIGAGSMLVDTVRALPQKVKTITLFSASMAFHMVEAFDERLIIPSGTLMSHRASLGGLGGEIGGDGKGELATRLNWIIRRLQVMDAEAAGRMQMNLKDYQELIRDEFWVSGSDSLSYRAADRVVLARCGKDLLKGTDDIKLMTIFGAVRLQFSKCPLISYPVAVDLSGLKFITPRDEEDTKRFFQLLFDDKKAFVQTYIVNNAFEKILTK